jgi:DHA1 family bicyclomycin/chloramphenicol resistance-like MFS transporter
LNAYRFCTVPLSTFWISPQFSPSSCSRRPDGENVRWVKRRCASFTSGSFFAYLGGAPYVGNVVFGLSSSEVGLLFAITAVGYLVGNFIAGRFSVRLGMNRMILWGILASISGLGLLTLVTLAGVHSPYVFFGFTLALGLGNGMTLPNANAGMLSIKPELAGTASGLGGAIQIGGGAALAALAGALLTEGATEMPLVLLMLASAILALFSILAVIRRARTLGLSA